jgi:Domain of unknown function (DUF5615)
MSLIRILIDEDAMDHRFANALRARGADVITVGDIGTFSFSDEDQLALAVERNRTFYTFNVGDFCQLHNLYLTTGKVHNGIIISSQEYSIGEQMRRVLFLMERYSAEAMVNQLVFLSSYSSD